MSGTRDGYFSLTSCAVLLFVAIISVISCAADNEKVVYSFTGGIDGGDAAAQLVFDSAGNMYGTTVVGGLYGCGTVFELSPSGDQWQETVLYNFDCFATGKSPYGGVALDSGGNLYGTTVAGGSGGDCAGDGCGVVYELTKSGDAWNETVLYNFTGGDDGFGAGGAVVFDQAGNLYGTTPDGGAYQEGVVYQLSPGQQQWNFTVIHPFTGGDDGAVGSLGPLLVDTHGTIYGVTELGGKYGAGVAFSMSKAGNTWNFTTLYAFQGLPDAGFPYGGVIADARGTLYGTTYFGGVNGLGSVFEIAAGATVKTPWQESVLYSFQGDTDSSFPTSALVFDAAGNLFGTGSTGGNPSCDCGAIFELTPRSGGGWDESVLHAFGGSGDGQSPSYGLTPDGKGNYFGVTPVGGAYGQGTVFQITPPSHSLRSRGMSARE
jgi:uncharacterized repeat protein (TIGR03803 family)